MEAYMRDGKTPRCQKWVYSRDGWGRSHQCSRSAKVDGTWCRQHDPKAAKRRLEERAARYETEWQRRRLEIAGPRFHAALRQIAEGHNDPGALAREVLEKFDASS